MGNAADVSKSGNLMRNKMKSIVQSPIKLVLASVCILMLAMLMPSPNGNLSVQKVFATGGSETFTTIADFENCAQGKPEGSNYKVINESNGELSLAATFEDDFSGTTLDTGLWNLHYYDSIEQTPPATANGLIRLKSGSGDFKGSNIQSTQTYTPNVSTLVLSGTLTFGAGKSQHFGFASDNFADDRFAMFSTASTTDRLFIRTYNQSNGSGNTDIGQLPNGNHKYRIEWRSLGDGDDEVKYYLDDVLVGTHISSSFPALHVTLSSDAGNTNIELQASSVRLLPYSPTIGTYIGCIVDSGTLNSVWGQVTWDAVTPSGALLTVEMQAANNTSSFNNSGPWTAVTNGASPALSGRYARYRVTLSGTQSVAPQLQRITIGYAPPPTPTPTASPTSTSTATATATAGPITPTPTAAPTASASPTPIPNGNVRFVFLPMTIR
ncbi:MAG: hypothetical protein HC828_16750 [Blastochloris sp.]|nr:hypothetical protein [Blastochloris sp.]